MPGRTKVRSHLDRHSEGQEEKAIWRTRGKPKTSDGYRAKDLWRDEGNDMLTCVGHVSQVHERMVVGSQVSPSKDYVATPKDWRRYAMPWWSNHGPWRKHGWAWDFGGFGSKPPPNLAGRCFGGLGIKPPCRRRSWFRSKPWATSFLVRASKPKQGFDYGTWHHRRGSVEAKEAIGCAWPSVRVTRLVSFLFCPYGLF